MPRFKIKLACTVELTATLEFEMEAENEESAYENAIEEYNKQDEAYQQKIVDYRRTYKGGYPEAPFHWTTDDDDIEANMDPNDIEVTETEEIDG